MTNKSLFSKIIRVFIPMVIYLVVTSVSAASFSIVLMTVSSLMEKAGKGGVGEADMVMLVNSASSLVVTVILWVMYENDRRKRSVEQAFEEKNRGSLPLKGLIISAGLLVCIFGNYFINLFPMTESSEGFKEVDYAISNSNIVIAVISTVIVAPLSEELLMRGLIFRRMRDYAGFLPSALFSSLIFGLIHMNIVQGIYAFAAGMVFAFICERYQSVRAAMLCHGAANLGSFFVGILFLLTGDLPVAMAAAMAVSLGLLMIVLRKIYIKVPYSEEVYVGDGNSEAIEPEDKE